MTLAEFEEEVKILRTNLTLLGDKTFAALGQDGEIIPISYEASVVLVEEMEKVIKKIKQRNENLH